MVFGEKNITSTIIAPLFGRCNQSNLKTKSYFMISTFFSELTVENHAEAKASFFGRSEHRWQGPSTVASPERYRGF